MNSAEMGFGSKAEVDPGQMSAQERVEYFRGKVADYNTRVETGFERAVGKIDPSDPARDEVLRAFQLRVEDNLSAPGASHGGGALDHLPQMGRQVITEEQYQTLQREALAVAASIIDASGHSDYARGAWAKLGRMSSSEQAG